MEPKEDVDVRPRRATEIDAVDGVVGAVAGKHLGGAGEYRSSDGEKGSAALIKLGRYQAKHIAHTPFKVNVVKWVKHIFILKVRDLLNAAGAVDRGQADNSSKTTHLLANNNNNNNNSMTKEMKEDKSNSSSLLVQESGKKTKETVEAENGKKASTEKTKTPQVIVNNGASGD